VDVEAPDSVLTHDERPFGLGGGRGPVPAGPWVNPEDEEAPAPVLTHDERLFGVGGGSGPIRAGRG